MPLDFSRHFFYTKSVGRLSVCGRWRKATRDALLPQAMVESGARRAASQGDGRKATRDALPPKAMVESDARRAASQGDG